jgi:hypothetical protein
MWIFLNNAFLSIVAHRTKPDTLLVRARVRGDIERVFPRAKVSRTPDADYLYRAEVARVEVSVAISSAAAGIAYPNFKGSVQDRDRLATYHDVWDVMWAWQGRRDVDDRPPRAGGLAEPDLVTGDHLLTRTGLDVQVERVQTIIGGDPIVTVRYLRSGKRFTHPERMARQRLRGATFLGPF